MCGRLDTIHLTKTHSLDDRFANCEMRLRFVNDSASFSVEWEVQGEERNIELSTHTLKVSWQQMSANMKEKKAEMMEG